MTAPKPMDPSASAALIRSALPHIEADDLRVQVAHALANLLALTKRLGEELEGLRADRDEAVAKLRVVVAGQTGALDKLGRSWQSRLDAEQAKTNIETRREGSASTTPQRAVEL